MAIINRIKGENINIKSIIYLENNIAKVEYDNFNEIIEKYNDEDRIVIYKPTAKQKEMILSIAQEEVENGNEDGFSPINIYKLLCELSTLNLVLDLDNEEDMEFWTKTIEDPSDLIEVIVMEIHEIITHMTIMVDKRRDSFERLPKHVKELLIEKAKNKKLKKETEEIKNDFLKRKSELEAELKKLEEENNGVQ